MRYNLVILLVTMLCGAGLTYLLDYAQNKPSATLLSSEGDDVKGAIVPDFNFETMDGVQGTIVDLRGKVVVLNFWASWCAPCVKEFPLLLDVALAHKKDVVLLALSSDHDEKAMNRFLDKMRSAYPEAMAAKNVKIAVDKKSVVTQNIFQTFRLPETIIIDRDGVMREKLIGANWSVDDLNRVLNLVK